jgi:folate-binding protein YgfZ
MLASGVLRLTGRDVLPVLHNVSTQGLLDLAPGEARLALLCDFRGRLLHRFAAARLADGSVWLVREDGGGASLAGAIGKIVFREDVRIEDESERWQVRAEFGAGPGAEPPGIGRAIEARGRPARIEIGGCPALVLSESGAALDADAAAAWSQARIERGWAAHGHEVSEAFTPFDVNLGAGVHLDKGCFTGQETLMRLVTYGDLRRRLVRVRGSGSVPGTKPLRDPGGQDVGVLASALPSDSGWSGLAVVKTSAASEGTAMLAGDGEPVHVDRVFAFLQPAGRVLKER